ncbi:MAG TPA: SDR family oxidoreductase [Pedobacter sp.]|nr:SDR family oxidoreductase [Pedobacter sp.]
MNKTISILGCGWYGLPLAKELISLGYEVKGSTTTKEKMPALREAGIKTYLIEAASEKIKFADSFFESDILIICIPPKRSEGAQESYAGKIENIADAAGKGTVKQVIFISSTSVYGDVNQAVTESTTPKPDTASGHVLLAAEEILQNQQAFKSTIIRFAGLVGPDRDPARFFAGKSNVPNGLAPVNLIHLYDCIGITISIMEQHAYGFIINAVSADHPAKQEFYKQAANKSGLAVPSFINELNNWKTVDTNQIPSSLSYSYKIADWSQWLNEDKNDNLPGLHDK